MILDRIDRYLLEEELRHRPGWLEFFGFPKKQVYRLARTEFKTLRIIHSNCNKVYLFTKLKNENYERTFERVKILDKKTGDNLFSIVKRYVYRKRMTVTIRLGDRIETRKIVSAAELASRIQRWWKDIMYRPGGRGALFAIQRFFLTLQQ